MSSRLVAAAALLTLCAFARGDDCLPAQANHTNAIPKPTPALSLPFRSLLPSIRPSGFSDKPPAGLVLRIGHRRVNISYGADPALRQRLDAATRSVLFTFSKRRSPE